MISIVLADDHKIVRQGIKSLLEMEPDFRIIGEAGDGLEAVRCIENLHPDILVVDLSMPYLSGIEVIREIQKRSPKTGIIVLSMHSTEAYVLQALEAGAVGYVLKESGLDQLVHAIREAVAGHLYLSPPLSEKALEAYRLKFIADTGHPPE